jgi:hypothetical protein
MAPVDSAAADPLLSTQSIKTMIQTDNQKYVAEMAALNSDINEKLARLMQSRTETAEKTPERDRSPRRPDALRRDAPGDGQRPRGSRG